MIHGVDYFGFVYVWYDRCTRRLCVGSHFGAYDDGYVTGTGRMWDVYRVEPSRFMRRIVYWHKENCVESLRCMEREWLLKIPVRQLGGRFYNQRRVPNGGDTGAYHKVSLRLKGRTKPQEHREKISATLMGRKLGPHSVIHSARISAALRGRRHSAEHVANNSAAQKQWYKEHGPHKVDVEQIPKRLCIYCGGVFIHGMFARWHGWKCKCVDVLPVNAFLSLGA